MDKYQNFPNLFFMLSLLGKSVFKATSEARCLIVCVGFFRQNVTSLSKPISPRQFKTLKTEQQLNALSGHERKFLKFFAWAILLASKTRFLRKFLGFFPILRNFTT